MTDDKRKTGGSKAQQTSALPDTAEVRQARADAAAEILEDVRRLRRTAEAHELKMIVYLLDMVGLEARDRMNKPRRDTG